jgi:hypothetical protein
MQPISYLFPRPFSGICSVQVMKNHYLFYGPSNLVHQLRILSLWKERLNVGKGKAIRIQA